MIMSDNRIPDTIQALRTATFTANKPGACYYLQDGKRCIVGEVLSNAGVADSILLGDEGSEVDDENMSSSNTHKFLSRPDLITAAQKFGLSPDILGRAQQKWD